MDAIMKICDTLDKIENHLLRLELETIEIFDCPADDIGIHSDERVRLVGKIDECNKEIDSLAQSTQDYELIKQALKNKCDYENLPEKIKPIFSKAQQANSVIYRIQDSDSQAVDRITRERDDLLEKIRNMNKGQEAKAAKFYAGTNTDGNGRYLPEQTKKI